MKNNLSEPGTMKGRITILGVSLHFSCVLILSHDLLVIMVWYLPACLTQTYCIIFYLLRSGFDYFILVCIFTWKMVLLLFSNS